jgi:hypothetical protein
VAQAQEVHIGPKADTFGMSGQKGQVGHWLVQRCCRWYGRVLVVGIRRAGHGFGEDQVIGEPDRFEAELLAQDRHLQPLAPVHQGQPDSELHPPPDPLARITDPDGSRTSTPDIVGDIDDEPELGHLVLVGEPVALDGRREAALRR